MASRLVVAIGMPDIEITLWRQVEVDTGMSAIVI